MIASLIGTCISAAIYFIAPKMVSVEGDSISSIIHKFIKRDYFLDLGSKYEDFSSDLASALWNALRGNGFLITAVIFFLVLVIAVITMAVQGNENAYSNSYYEPTPGPMPIPVPDPGTDTIFRTDTSSDTAASSGTGTDSTAAGSAIGSCTMH